MFTVNTLHNTPGKNRQGLLALALATGRDQVAGNWSARWNGGSIVLRYFWTDLISVDAATGTALDISPNGLAWYSVSTQCGLSVATGTTKAERREQTRQARAVIAAGAAIG